MPRGKQRPLTGKIITDERYADVQQVIKPAGHDGRRFGKKDLNELTLEQFVTVEEDVVGEPADGRSQNTTTEVLEGQAERLDIVASDGSLLLGSRQLLAGGLHVVGTVVDQPQGADGRDTE